MAWPLDDASKSCRLMFLNMRDVDHPEWRVSMFDSADRARWAEILRQELREVGIAA